MDIIKTNFINLFLQAVKNQDFNYKSNKAKVKSTNSFFYSILFYGASSFVTVFFENLLYIFNFLIQNKENYRNNYSNLLNLNFIFIDKKPFEEISFLLTPKIKEYGKISL